jgi:hypothetical protein
VTSASAVRTLISCDARNTIRYTPCFDVRLAKPVGMSAGEQLDHHSLNTGGVQIAFVRTLRAPRS